jgi:hypothetical protein
MGILTSFSGFKITKLGRAGNLYVEVIYTIGITFCNKLFRIPKVFRIRFSIYSYINRRASHVLTLLRATPQSTFFSTVLTLY